MEKTETSPFDIGRRYPKGALLEARVQTIKPFEAVLELCDGTKGIIRNRELSWEREPSHPQEVLKVGQKVKVLVIGIDRMRSRLKLSLRQAVTDPWKGIDKRYKVGQVVSCKVVALAGDGGFLEVEPAVCGFVRLNEVCVPPPHHIHDVLWIGDATEAVVTELRHEERRIGLSIKRRLQLLEHQVDGLLRRKRLEAENSRRSSLGELLSEQERLSLLSYLRGRGHGAPDEDAVTEMPSALTKVMRRILLADDSPSFRGSLQRLLTRLGHKVEAVDSAERAVEVCSKNEFDLYGSYTKKWIGDQCKMMVAEKLQG